MPEFTIEVSIHYSLRIGITIILSFVVAGDGYG